MGALDNGTRSNMRLKKSAAVDETRDLSRRETQDQGGSNVVSTGISFTASNTIADSNNGFGVFSVGQQIQISGAGINDIRCNILTVAAGSMTVEPSRITTAGAGPTIMIRAN